MQLQVFLRPRGNLHTFYRLKDYVPRGELRTDIKVVAHVSAAYKNTIQRKQALFEKPVLQASDADEAELVPNEEW